MARRKKDDIMDWCEELARETIELGDADFLKELSDAIDKSNAEFNSRKRKIMV